MLVSRSGLVTVTGGKWTTYRAMAEDVLAQCMGRGLIPSRPAGVTRTLRLAGALSGPGAASSRKESISAPAGLHAYGVDAAVVEAMPGAERVLCDGLTEAMVRFAARHEYAMTVEDVLARRSRLLFLDARLAGQLAAQVAGILHEETGRDPQLDAFLALAQQYQLVP